jgi:hypothetical protein
MAPIVDHMQFELLSGKNSGNKNTSLNDLGKSSAHNISAFRWQFTEVAAFSKKASFRIDICFCLSQQKTREVSNLGRKLRT